MGNWIGKKKTRYHERDHFLLKRVRTHVCVCSMHVAHVCIRRQNTTTTTIESLSTCCSRILKVKRRTPREHFGIRRARARNTRCIIRGNSQTSRSHRRRRQCRSLFSFSWRRLHFLHFRPRRRLRARIREQTSLGNCR